MLKKLSLTISVLAAMACVANANIIYNFTMPGGFYWAGMTSPGFLGVGGSATIQFNLAPDGVPDDVLPGGGFQQLGASLDINLGTWTITEGGTPVDNPAAFRPSANIDDFGWFNLGEYNALTPFDAFGDDSNDGFVTGPAVVYGQVFQSDTIAATDYYYRGELDVAVTQDPTDPLAPPAPTYNLVRIGSTESLGLDEGQIDSPTFSGQVVPEPGTWALFAMGILTLAGVKFRSRK